VVEESSCGISGKWKKSSASTDGECVEVRRTISGIQVRDSKDPTGAVLNFTDAEWRAFLDGVALGEFRIPQAPTQRAV